MSKHSFVSYSLDAMKEGDSEQEEAIKQAAFSMYGGTSRVGFLYGKY